MNRPHEENVAGKVKWFNNQKGYGFIAREDGKADVFVHYSGIKTNGFRSLAENQKVRFDVESHQKGDRAVNVEVLP